MPRRPRKFHPLQSSTRHQKQTPAVTLCASSQPVHEDELRRAEKASLQTAEAWDLDNLWLKQALNASEKLALDCVAEEKALALALALSRSEVSMTISQAATEQEKETVVAKAVRQAERLFTSTGMSVAFTVVHTSGVCTDHDAGKQQADGLADWWTADAVTFEDTANSDSGDDGWELVEAG